jgi:hypothetical protein
LFLRSFPRLWKRLASSSPIYETALGQFSGEQFSPFMEMVTPQPNPFIETVQAEIEAYDATIVPFSLPGLRQIWS